MARNRFSDAIGIQEGACNISGIAQSLKDAAIEARRDGVDPSTDIAVRLIAGQLAFLCRVNATGGMRDIEYNEAMRMCREKAGV